MSIIFTKAGSPPTVATMRSPSAPKRPRFTLDQARVRAMGGRMMSLTRSSQVLAQPEITWRDLPDSDFLIMKTFLYVTVAGSTTQFVYTDEEAETMTVKYAGGIEDAQATGYAGVAGTEQLIWRVTVKLAEVPT